MKSELQSLEGLTRRLSIEIPPQVIAGALSKMYEDVRRVAEFKGFRKGKAPMNLVKSAYRSKVESDVAKDLILSHYGQAIDEHKLFPVSNPDFEFDSFKDGESFKFTAVFEVRPDINLKTYTGLEILKEKIEDKTSVVEGVIQDLRNSRATIEPLLVQRGAEVGDIAIVDFHGTVDGNDWSGSSGKEFSVELGTGHVFKDLENGILGMKLEQTKDISVTLPSDYKPENLAGKTANFNVYLRGISKKVLPELTDEFAKSLGSYDSVAALRERITADVNAQEEKRVRDDFKRRLLEKIIETNPFMVPKSMVATQIESIVQDETVRLKHSGLNDSEAAEYIKKWSGDISRTGEFTVKASLLMTAISQKENLIATDEEIEQRIAKYAEQTGIERERIDAHYSKPENRSRLKYQVTEEKVVGFLTEKNTTKEVTKEQIFVPKFN